MHGCSHDLPFQPRIYPPFCDLVRCLRIPDLPLPPRIYPSFSTNVYQMCDPPRIHPSLPEHTALFQQLYATLRESTPPSQNIPRFLTNLYVRPSQNLPIPSRINPPFSTNLYVRHSQNHQLLKRGGYILGGRGIFWECRI